MTYRETGNTVYLDFAQKLADVFLNRLPADYIPFWDFCAPNIPNEPKDASAGAIFASALIELHQITNNRKNEYLNYAEKMLLSLNDNYLDTESNKGCGFIIQHNVVSKPHDIGVDVYLNYADYYYLEACKKYLELDNI
jgi:unsaturated chondroitin disaccharide hydrolase